MSINNDHPRSDCELDYLPYSEAKSRYAMQTKIGQELRARYEVPQDLPRDMLRLLLRILNSAGKN
jgi:hypothetical protein